MIPSEIVEILSNGLYDQDEKVVKIMELVLRDDNSALDHYQNAALKTDLSERQYKDAWHRLGADTNMQLLHACMGLCTEIGELMDAMKKFVFYGKIPDFINMHEEGGDLLWYIRLLAHGLKGVCEGKCSFAEMLRRNEAKLRQRYGDKFNEDKALNRDLDAERKILESGTENKE